MYRAEGLEHPARAWNKVSDPNSLPISASGGWIQKSGFRCSRLAKESSQGWLGMSGQEEEGRDASHPWLACQQPPRLLPLPLRAQCPPSRYSHHWHTSRKGEGFSQEWSLRGNPAGSTLLVTQVGKRHYLWQVTKMGLVCPQLFTFLQWYMTFSVYGLCQRVASNKTHPVLWHEQQRFPCKPLQEHQGLPYARRRVQFSNRIKVKNQSF